MKSIETARAGDPVFINRLKVFGCWNFLAGQKQKFLKERVLDSSFLIAGNNFLLEIWKTKNNFRK